MPLRALPALLLLAALPAFAAEPPPVAKAEIQHLLDYLGSSGCQFFRNGTSHPAADARDHIQKKYTALLERNLVKTAEEFISRAAAESSTSGKSYQVRCGGSEPVASARWLDAELARYRRAAAGRK